MGYPLPSGTHYRLWLRCSRTAIRDCQNRATGPKDDPHANAFGGRLRAAIPRVARAPQPHTRQSSDLGIRPRAEAFARPQHLGPTLSQMDTPLGSSRHFSPIPGNGAGGAREMRFSSFWAATPLSRAAVRRKQPCMRSAAAPERFLVRFCPNLDCRPCRALSASSIT